MKFRVIQRQFHLQYYRVSPSGDESHPAELIVHCVREADCPGLVAEVERLTELDQSHVVVGCFGRRGTGVGRVEDDL